MNSCKLNLYTLMLTVLTLSHINTIAITKAPKTKLGASNTGANVFYSTEQDLSTIYVIDPNQKQLNAQFDQFANFTWPSSNVLYVVFGRNQNYWSQHHFSSTGQDVPQVGFTFNSSSALTPMSTQFIPVTFATTTTTTTNNRNQQIIPGTYTITNPTKSIMGSVQIAAQDFDINPQNRIVCEIRNQAIMLPTNLNQYQCLFLTYDGSLNVILYGLTTQNTITSLAQYKAAPGTPLYVYNQKSKVATVTMPNLPNPSVILTMQPSKSPEQPLIFESYIQGNVLITTQPGWNEQPITTLIPSNYQFDTSSLVLLAFNYTVSSGTIDYAKPSTVCPFILNMKTNTITPITPISASLAATSYVTASSSPNLQMSLIIPPYKLAMLTFNPAATQSIYMEQITNVPSIKLT